MPEQQRPEWRLATAVNSGAVHLLLAGAIGKDVIDVIAANLNDEPKLGAVSITERVEDIVRIGRGRLRIVEGSVELISMGSSTMLNGCHSVRTAIEDIAEAQGADVRYRLCDYKDIAGAKLR